MSKTVILVTHHVSEHTDLGNRASSILGGREFDLHWVHTPAGDPLPEPDETHAGAIVFGGAQDISEMDQHAFMKAEVDWIGRWAESGAPFLGICLGSQMLAHALGAPIGRHPDDIHEIGYYPVRPTDVGGDFIPDPFHVYHWHKEGVFDLPTTCTPLATGDDFPHQAFRYKDTAYGLQFHPEVTTDIMVRWLGEAGEALDRKGAHTHDRQIADSGKYNTVMGDWFEGFLARLFPSP